MTAAPVERRPVQRLAPDLVARIAAGEVVERPASVVKELVENAVDAGATSIWVRLTTGGLTRIEVTDNGTGIPRDELGLALERHATSKLDPGGPIHRIGTLGFRGEALAAIGAISRLELVSRPPESDRAHGRTLLGGVEGRELVEGHPVGTTVRVHDLFFNTPARRKFMHAPAAEQVEILSTVERLYLARPEVGLSVEAEGRVVARYPATTSLLEASAHVFGADFPAQSFPLAAELPTSGYVRGVLGRPAAARGSASGLYFAMNGRSVFSRVLAQAIKVAYQGYIPRTRFPTGVVHLELDLERLDVNVHPTKREVRIVREREIADALRQEARRALQGTPMVSELPESLPSPEAVGSHRNLGALSAYDPVVPLPIRFDSGHASQRRLFDEGPPSAIRQRGSQSALVLQGVLFRLYWIAEGAEGLVLIDQHAASERLLFDSILAHGRLARQELLSPVTLHLTARQAQLLQQMETTVDEAGYEVDRFAADAYRIRSVPVHHGHLAPPETLIALLDELANGGRPSVPNGIQERRAASIACHAAVRAGDSIERRQMERILLQLEELPEANYACPHGRPIRVQITRARLDRWFLRSGG
ncbi:MAG: DNA mismatch repair endonuclease MutL [Thermoplasmata archaeon]